MSTSETETGTIRETRPTLLKATLTFGKEKQGPITVGTVQITVTGPGVDRTFNGKHGSEPLPTGTYTALVGTKDPSLFQGKMGYVFGSSKDGSTILVGDEAEPACFIGGCFGETFGGGGLGGWS